MALASAPPRHDARGALADALGRMAPRLAPGATGIEALELMTGGASHETWAFRLTGTGERLVLRRAPEEPRPGAIGVGLDVEAAAIARAGEAGVPVPRVRARLSPQDGVGTGIVVTRVEGEALPRRVLRDPRFAPARDRFARDAGRILAAIHGTGCQGLGLVEHTPQTTLASLAARHAELGEPRPVFELALRWLADHVPPARPPRLVHGDFRMGNLLFGPDGIRAVLDWELVHAGDPHEDLGWLAMRSWRFGASHVVGGLCAREALWAAYEAAGGAPVDPAAARWWETLAALRWGVIVEEMARWIAAGIDRSVERHVIARRASEAEWTLLSDLTARLA